MTPQANTGTNHKRPHDHELEQAVIGALLLEKEALTDVIEILKVDTFDKEAHQLIYEAIITLFGETEPIDLLTVINRLKKSGSLEKAGGPAYIASLTQKVNSAANIIFHCRLLVEYAIKRQMIQISSGIQKEAFDDKTDVFELMERMETALFDVSELNIRKNYSGMKEVLTEVVRELETLKDHQDGLTGVPSGFSNLDRVTSGWQKDDLVIIAARPAMGKTAFSLSTLRNAAVGFDKAVVIFSLEMSAAQLVKRLVSAEAELESDKLRKGNLNEMEWQRFIDKTGSLAEAPLFIDDTPALTVLELRAKCRRLKAQHDIQLVVIDYLQLMSAGDNKSKGNREQEIAFISRSLKQLAKELSVPVIALSQLSRAVETRGGDKRPQLSDLRESGSIEQDADMVMFLYRPEYYDITEDEEGNSTVGMGEVIIAKNRAGSLENIKLRFIGKYTKFTDWDEGGFMDVADIQGDPGALMSTGSMSGVPGDDVSFDDMLGNTKEEEGGDGTITLGSKINERNKGNQPAPPPEDPPF
ncbi:replicative DNA helicase [Algivirga pacifica]|uniref:Replicative DNA helicase n=1 Tax=Algivirga pacifica TaxID=1162670 RepID=A0ABP9D1A8_9BACT